ncbi:conserved hypothetical protein [Latilactobacillus sakei]|nr:conserved hypothetical protein [Latilactobacillus sakei]SOB44624.1 conserved hypothetical protein [Latilactobacillus sakei]
MNEMTCMIVNQFTAGTTKSQA